LSALRHSPAPVGPFAYHGGKQGSLFTVGVNAFKWGGTTQSLVDGKKKGAQGSADDKKGHGRSLSGSKRLVSCVGKSDQRHLGFLDPRKNVGIFGDREG